jgi:hypothetical protein
MFHFSRLSSSSALLLPLFIIIISFSTRGSFAESNVIINNNHKEQQDQEKHKSSFSSSSSWWSWSSRPWTTLKCSFSCPTSDDYSPECLDAITPPWPICLRHSSAEEWVNIAIDSIPRCCGGDDLPDCKCPMKDSQYFLNRIDDYCDGAEICSNEKKSASSAQMVQEETSVYTQQE